MPENTRICFNPASRVKVPTRQASKQYFLIPIILTHFSRLNIYALTTLRPYVGHVIVKIYIAYYE
ncbi:MAG: hypothetical protein CMJ45_12160 [Planctomyces sp.]|nr:hypothetical protein [Planctomyces sp.]